MASTKTAIELIDEAIAKLDALMGQSPSAAVAKPAPAPATVSAAAAAPATQTAAANGAPSTPAAAPANPKQANNKQPSNSKQQAAAGAAAPAAASSAPAAAAAAAAAAPAGGSDALAMFQKVLIKVARVLSVELVENSDKLYRLKVDVGGGDVRQVCAGLRQFLAPEQLQDQLVTAVCNLKPAKLAGNLSEAMLLAGEHEAPAGLLVRTLIPPAGSQPGDQVYLQGGAAATDTPKQVKSDHFKVVVAALRVEGGKATVNGTPLVTDKGCVTLPAEIPEGASIH